MSTTVTNAIVPISPQGLALKVEPRLPEVEVVTSRELEKQAMVVPAPTLNIIFVREGNKLTGIGHLVNGGKLEVIRVSVDLVELCKVFYPEGQKVGFLGDIVSAISSIAKSSVVKSIVNTAKSVVTSKELGAVVGGLAVVFPPVGLPAAGAYAAANVALKYLDNGKKAIDRAQTLLKSGKKLTPRDKSNLTKLIAKRKKAQEKIKKVVALAKEEKKRGGPSPKLKELQQKVAQKNKELKAAGRKERYIPPVPASGYTAILRKVQKSRAEIENIKRSLAIPQRVEVAPRLVQTPIGKSDPIIVFWRKYLKTHPKPRSFFKAA